jgi:hypothetical protein
VLVHKDSKNYKVLIKALLRGACEPLSTEDVKEVENAAGTIRADKVKAEKAAAAAKSKSECRDHVPALQCACLPHVCSAHMPFWLGSKNCCRCALLHPYHECLQRTGNSCL